MALTLIGVRSVVRPDEWKNRVGAWFRDSMCRRCNHLMLHVAHSEHKYARVYSLDETGPDVCLTAAGPYSFLLCASPEVVVDYAVSSTLVVSGADVRWEQGREKHLYHRQHFKGLSVVRAILAQALPIDAGLTCVTYVDSLVRSFAFSPDNYRSKMTPDEYMRAWDDCWGSGEYRTGEVRFQGWETLANNGGTIQTVERNLAHHFD